MNFKTICILALCISILLSSKAQTIEELPFVKSSVKIVIEDSNYFLFPQIQVLNKKKKISLPKNIGYNIATLTDNEDSKIYVQKRMGSYFVYLSMDILPELSFDPGYNKIILHKLCY